MSNDSSVVTFWSKVQLTSLGAFFTALVMSFFLTWWLLAVAAMCLVLNGIAYSIRMKESGRDPATRDVEEIL